MAQETGSNHGLSIGQKNPERKYQEPKILFEENTELLSVADTDKKLAAGQMSEYTERSRVVLDSQ